MIDEVLGNFWKLKETEYVEKEELARCNKDFQEGSWEQKGR